MPGLFQRGKPVSRALPLGTQDTPPCLSYLRLIQSLFYPVNSTALCPGEQRELRAACSSLHLTADPVLPHTGEGREEGRKGGFTAVPPIPGAGSHSALLCRSAWKANLKPSREFLQAALRRESPRLLPCSPRAQGKHSPWFSHPQPHTRGLQPPKTPPISEPETTTHPPLCSDSKKESGSRSSGMKAHPSLPTQTQHSRQEAPGAGP